MTATLRVDGLNGLGQALRTVQVDRQRSIADTAHIFAIGKDRGRRLSAECVGLPR